MTDEQFRMRVLQILWEQETAEPYSLVETSELAEALKRSREEINRECEILESQGLITLQKAFQGNFHARIAPPGMLVLEQRAETRAEPSPIELAPAEGQRAEALGLLQRIVDSLVGEEPNVVACMRMYLQTTQLLGLMAEEAWATSELQAYSDDADLPSYRSVSADIGYSPRRAFDISSEMVYGKPQPEQDRVSYSLLDSIDSLLQSLETGYRWTTGRSETVTQGRKQVVYEEFTRIPPDVVRHVVQSITNRLFQRTSRLVIDLRYSEVARRSLEQYRERTDAAVARLGLENVLSNVQANLKPEDPETLKACLITCRNVIIALAEKLWLAPDDTHPHLTDKSGKKPMSLTKYKPKNRLIAYIHEKVPSRSRRQLLRGQAERMGSVVHDLYEFESKGKTSATYEEALSALVNTYIFIGDLALFTDLEPVTEISDRGATMAAGTDHPGQSNGENWPG